MDDSELIEKYKEGLRVLADHLGNYSRSTLTGPRLGPHVRVLTTAANKKYTKTGYAGLLETIHLVSKELDVIYAGEDYQPLWVTDDREQMVSIEAFRLSNTMVGLGVRGIFDRFDAERARHKYRQGTTVNDDQKKFLKNLKIVSDVLNTPIASKEFSAMTTELFLIIRELQSKAFPRVSDGYFSTHMIQCFGTEDAWLKANKYVETLKLYQGLVHEMLRVSGVTPKNGNPIGYDLEAYGLWLEDELANLEELYLCITYQRILNVL